MAGVGRAVTARYGNPRRSAAGGTLQARTYVNTNEVIELLEAQTGAFRSGAFQRMLSEANHQLARETTRLSLAKLEAQTRHRRADTGNLEVTIGSDRMYRATASGFAWGLTSWLNASPAKTYWRVADMGSEPYWTEAAFATAAGGKPIVPLPPGTLYWGDQARMPQHLEWAVAPRLGDGMNSRGDRSLMRSRDGQLVFGRKASKGDEAVLNWVRTRKIEIHPAHAKYFMNPWESTRALTAMTAQYYHEGAARLGIPLTFKKT